MCGNSPVPVLVDVLETATCEYAVLVRTSVLCQIRTFQVRLRRLHVPAPRADAAGDGSRTRWRPLPPYSPCSACPSDCWVQWRREPQSRRLRDDGY